MVTSLVESVNRIIEESVPGKQVTIAHVIASNSPAFMNRWELKRAAPSESWTLSPYETSMIAADIAVKAADVDIGFLDRFTGSVVIMGDVQSVETALKAVTEKLKTILQFDVVPVTKT